MKSETVHFFLKKGILLNPDLSENLDSENMEELNNLFEDFSKYSTNSLILNNSIYKSLYLEKEEDLIIPNIDNSDYPVVITKEYAEVTKKKEVSDFTQHYKKRFNLISKILQSKRGLENSISIHKILNKRQRESVSLIGYVSSKNITKNKNMILTLEDLTGSIKVIITKDKIPLFEDANNLCLDEIIGINGSTGNKVVFADDLYFPDVPKNDVLKKCDEEIYLAVISDVHVGSTMFLENDFLKFIKWINGTVGNSEQKNVALKVKYLFVVGDLVDGVGIYPNQDDELNIKDIFKQYDKFGELISMIRKDVKIIICPGNHDAVRIAEPQPILDKDYIKTILKLPNVISVTNPSFVNIHASEGFEGFDVLLYHGYSFDYYINNVGIIRNNGGYDRPDLVMKYLLQKRHLAPSHGSTLFIPDPDDDFLTITKVPDFFLAGHVHKPAINQYGKVTNICGSCWQSKTPFQEKVGHKPEPSKVQLVNLKTREIKVMNFGE
ncbi:DNA-directed DNA polymerase II small subunit [archaeon]|jgi:DNA polymerase II small subunit|nr:DNA-directed DNA polymerase II small subunit [archaeon]MBT6824108.1 DNA-directed DNA polymerase II small subunit [archaeon]MBT7107047.1 DNA-directed DNA polymerase II small subunit [archaeon]MBT7297659.1 DNA-directed DNA polymerase II small subunit [archaeon]